MPISPKAQLDLMLSALLLGLFAGIAYDFLRVIRRIFSYKSITALSDIFFSLSYFISLFFLGYTSGQGVQRFYAPAFSVLGAALYFFSLSPFTLKFFTAAAAFISKILKPLMFPVNFLKKLLKKLFNFLKNRFQSSKFCYTIKCKCRKADERNGKAHHPLKGTVYEAEKGRYYY